MGFTDEGVGSPREALSQRLAGRMATALFVGGGVGTLASALLPTAPSGDRGGVVVNGLTAVAVGVAPAGSFSLRQSDGSPVEASAVTMDTVYASTTTALEAALTEPLPPGEYCAMLSLTDATTGAHDETACLAFSVAAAVETPTPGQNPAVSFLDMLPGTSAMASTASGVLSVIGGSFVIVAVLLAGRRRRRSYRAGTRIREAHR